ncbi:MAG: 23S rRNA (guanosine(2251)-2'-O)-methyltransferase RlmB [Acutalibacteraceae bacterium]
MPFNDKIPSDVVAGRNAVNEVLRSGREIEFLMVAKGAGGSVVPIIAECKKRHIPIKEMPRQKLDLKLPGVNHQGVAIVVSSGEYSTVEEILETAKKDNKPPFILILDEIEDPHNLGAIIRTAEASGVHGIIIPKRRSVGINNTVYKTACGAAEYVKVARVSNLVSAIDTLKENGVWIYGTDMNGENIFETDFKSACALVIGNEGKGIGRLVKEKCDFCVKIPMFGKINSLNASVAAGISMYSVVKSRNFDK